MLHAYKEKSNELESRDDQGRRRSGWIAATACWGHCRRTVLLHEPGHETIC